MAKKYIGSHLNSLKRSGQENSHGTLIRKFIMAYSYKANFLKPRQLIRVGVDQVT